MIKNIITQVIENVKKIKINKLSKKIALLSMTSKIAALSIIIATTPLGTMQVKADEDVIKASTGYAGNVRANLSTTNPLYIDQKEIKSFNVVESEFNRIQREEREKQAADEASKKTVSTRAVVSRESTRTVSDPDIATKRALVKRAAAKWGIDWKILEAVWQVESGKAWDTSVKSSAGAGGPMQFMPSTWRGYAQDGNGDGVANMYSAEDALFGAAQLLAQSGASWGDINSALLSYNHAQWYVDKVKGVANSITE